MDTRLLDFSVVDKPFFPLKEELLSEHTDYVIHELYAKGGVKNIFRSYHSKTGRYVAMAKLRDTLSESEEEQERFLREGRITAYLSHPNIIPVYAIDFHEEKPFFSMKLIHGDSLQTILTELAKGNESYEEEYPLSSLLDIFLKVCEALAYAHSRGVVHLDVKPDNIRVNRFGEVLLCDWGLAKIIREPEEKSSEEEAILLDANLHNEITLTGTLKGTPGYMAPEQVDSSFGEKIEETDIYSLGCLLYAILTLERPLKRCEALVDVLRRTKKGDILTPSELCPQRTIAAGLEATCLHAMETKQLKRYASVEELSDDIRAYLQGFTTSAEGSGVFKEARYFLKRHKMVAVTLLAFFVLISLFMYNLYLKEQRAKRNEERASRNLALYKEEKEVAEYFNRAGVKSILRNLAANFRGNSAETNHKMVDYIIKKNPQNRQAMGLKGAALFALQRYDEAEPFLAKGSGYEGVLKSCRKMLAGQDHFEMLRDLYNMGEYSLAAQFVGHSFSQEMTLKEKNIWLKKHFFICNPKVQKDSVKIAYIDGVESRFSLVGDGQVRVKNLSFLGYLPIKKMILKDLKHFTSYELDYSSIESITFINCEELDLWRIAGFRNLKELNFVNSAEAALVGLRKAVKVTRK